MNNNLDRWIMGAKDNVPDSGEYRRLNRVLLKERMLAAGTGRRRNHRVLIITVILAFLLLFSGQISFLGGDSFTLVPGEGEIIEVYGISYGGKTSWKKYVQQNINGTIGKLGQSLEDRPDVTPDNFQQFMALHMREIAQETRTAPPQRETLMTFDGVLCKMQVWVFNFPEYGEVLRFRGVPVEKS